MPKEVFLALLISIFKRKKNNPLFCLWSFSPAEQTVTPGKLTLSQLTSGKLANGRNDWLPWTWALINIQEEKNLQIIIFMQEILYYKLVL